MRNKILTVTLIAFCAVSLPLAADIKTNAAAASKAAAEASKKRSAGSASKLRCWQYGELLFEESGISNKTLSKDSGSIVFERGGDSRSKLFLVDFGTATCLFEE